MKRVAALNALQLQKAGFYQSSQASGSFDYSDGEESERRLSAVLNNATDLSSNSAELEAAITDWPTEYHLSTLRANLLRPLNFSGANRVLELGCGCGSITRYLGEQPGVTVDAVEGSPVRAALAALRCRDLDSVEITASNFHDLELPENEYDRVLLIGVTEYAGRFSNQVDDVSALQALISLAKRACKPEGQLIIAIENRLGMKYLLGANEDHYAMPYVGIKDYPESSGIRTYSYAQWQQQLDRAGLPYHQILFPFPDYKIPSALLSERATFEEVRQALEGLKSRDYAAEFSMGEHESLIWSGLAQAGTLREHANSFLILASEASNECEAMEFSSKVYATSTPAYLKLEVNQVGATQAPDHAQTQSKMSELQSTLDLVRGSKGWRLLDIVRKLIGRPTL